MPTTQGGDQQPFEETVRIALEVVAVLEGAGLAFVDVHCAMQPRRGLARTMRHLRPAGKPAPPRPRRPESSIAWMTDSTSRVPSGSRAAAGSRRRAG